MRSAIVSTGRHLPDRVVTNDELAGALNTTPEWIEERTGIRERRWVEPGETNAGMAAQAARRALAQAGLEVGEVDAIVAATLSAEAVFPGTGVFLQRELGLEGVPALDVRNQCSGFLYGLSIADAWIASGRYETVLLVGSEVHSTSLDLSPAGRGVTPLFGDGAGATIVRPASDGAGVIDVRLGADGRGAEHLWLEVPSSSHMPSISHEDLDAGRQFPHMDGRIVFRRAVETLEREIGRVLDAFDAIGPRDEVLLVAHQANRRINEMVADRLGLAPAQVVHTIDTWGNTTAASIPTALDLAREDGRAHPGRVVIMAAFGSGYTWGTAVVRL